MTAPVLEVDNKAKTEIVGEIQEMKSNLLEQLESMKEKIEKGKDRDTGLVDKRFDMSKLVTVLRFFQAEIHSMKEKILLSNVPRDNDLVSIDLLLSEFSKLIENPNVYKAMRSINGKVMNVDDKVNILIMMLSKWDQKIFGPTINKLKRSRSAGPLNKSTNRPFSAPVGVSRRAGFYMGIGRKEMAGQYLRSNPDTLRAIRKFRK